MSYGKVYERINNKFFEGVFTEGERCDLRKYHFEGVTIDDFSMDKRTPEVCSSLMAYGKCALSDVPKSSRTREFYISEFTNKDVYNYIKNNLEKFDRQFFKDLITTNNYSMAFEKNCFEIMPPQYIDEEMCSLAILKVGERHEEWFWSVYKRKPEALTSDIWKLAVRLYTRIYGIDNKYLNATPKKYRDAEYYREMCNCQFMRGKAIGHPEITIMDTIPEEIITKEFLLELLEEDLKNISKFNEKALEMGVTYTYKGKKKTEKIWQFVIRRDGLLIDNINLNDERINFFLNLYDKDTPEYIFGFKDYYKNYKRSKEEKEKISAREKENITNISKMVIMDAVLYVHEGENPNKAIDNEISRGKRMNSSLLPIKYQGMIPNEFIKTHDSEEYLEMLYKQMGVEIIEEYDSLFYSVNLPESWSLENNGYTNYVKDATGNVVIEYFYDSKFYDREAYVKNVNIIEEKVLKKNK